MHNKLLTYSAVSLGRLFLELQAPQGWCFYSMEKKVICHNKTFAVSTKHLLLFIDLCNHSYFFMNSFFNMNFKFNSFFSFFFLLNFSKTLLGPRWHDLLTLTCQGLVEAGGGQLCLKTDHRKLTIPLFYELDIFIFIVSAACYNS